MRALPVIPIVALLMIGAGCTEWHVDSVSPQQLIATQPSRVRVTLSAGNRLVIPHPSLIADTLVGGAADSSIRVPLSDVRHIATRQVSEWKTKLLIGGIVATTAVVLVVNALKHVHVNPGCSYFCPAE